MRRTLACALQRTLRAPHRRPRLANRVLLTLLVGALPAVAEEPNPSAEWKASFRPALELGKSSPILAFSRPNGQPRFSLRIPTI
jgi:hypothetical protein